MSTWAGDPNPACPSYQIPTEVYIFEKGPALQEIVKNSLYGLVLASLNLPPDLEAGIFQDLTEFGVGIMAKRLDPAIGQKVSTAALLPGPEFPLLLVAAYGRGLSQNFGMSCEDAAKTITAEEVEVQPMAAAFERGVSDAGGRRGERRPEDTQRGAGSSLDFGRYVAVAVIDQAGVLDYPKTHITGLFLNSVDIVDWSLPAPELREASKNGVKRV